MCIWIEFSYVFFVNINNMAFAYTLKHLDRASIVGEKTGVERTLLSMMRVNDDIDIRVPVVRVYSHRPYL